MRSALEQIDGVSDIDTNFQTHVCTFNFSNGDLDLVARLGELAKTNSHLAGWSVVESAK